MRQGSSRTDCINFWQWQNTYLGIIHKPKAWNIPLRSKNINHLKQNTYSVLVWPRSSGWLRPTVRGQRMANSKLSNSAWFNSVVNQRHTYYSKLCSKILKSNHSLNGKKKYNTERVSPQVFHLCYSLQCDVCLFIWIWCDLLYPLVREGLWLFV